MVAAVLLSTLLSAVCPRTQSIAQTQTEDQGGYTLLKKGDYDGALRQFNARVAMQPNDSLAERGLLQVYLETGRYVEAEAAARKFLTRVPTAGVVRHQL